MRWSLPTILCSLHDEVELQLSTARAAFAHPGTKGDASERVWLQLFKTYLPHRYQAASAHIVDCNGLFSDQIDLVIFDRQYSPFVFVYGGQLIVPAESVYAAFEVKQTLNEKHIRYAQSKIASVRRLHRTSLPIPTFNGETYIKVPHHIIGGLLTLDSEWSPPLGDPLIAALGKDIADGLIDLGCAAAHGTFGCDLENCFKVNSEAKAGTFFLLELIARLQDCGTVPMIDVRAYAKWLNSPPSDS
jgi:hypothetical protein